MHRAVAPVIDDGKGFTVTVVVAIHPAYEVKVIVAVPTDVPVTTPDIRPTLATVISLLTHDVPGADALAKVVDVVTHRLVLPVMAEGCGLTAMVRVI